MKYENLAEATQKCRELDEAKETLEYLLKTKEVRLYFGNSMPFLTVSLPEETSEHKPFEEVIYNVKSAEEITSNYIRTMIMFYRSHIKKLEEELLYL